MFQFNIFFYSMGKPWDRSLSEDKVDNHILYINKFPDICVAIHRNFHRSLKKNIFPSHRPNSGLHHHICGS